MTIPEELKDVLVSDPDYLSGAVRFKGTRVPVQCLLDTLLRNHSIDDFMRGFPGVTREQIDAVIHYEQNLMRKLFGINRAG